MGLATKQNARGERGRVHARAAADVGRASGFDGKPYKIGDMSLGLALSIDKLHAAHHCVPVPILAAAILVDLWEHRALTPDKARPAADLARMFKVHEGEILDAAKGASTSSWRVLNKGGSWGLRDAPRISLYLGDKEAVLNRAEMCRDKIRCLKHDAIEWERLAAAMDAYGVR